MKPELSHSGHSGSCALASSDFTFGHLAALRCMKRIPLFDSTWLNAEEDMDVSGIMLGIGLIVEVGKLGYT